jgi:hypothetical protein
LRPFVAQNRRKLWQIAPSIRSAKAWAPKVELAIFDIDRECRYKTLGALGNPDYHADEAQSPPRDKTRARRLEVKGGLT